MKKIFLFFLILAAPFSQIALAGEGEMRLTTNQVRQEIRPGLSGPQVRALRQAIVEARYSEDKMANQGHESLGEFLSQVVPGDILLLRSGNLLGTLAARSSDVPGQFAHVVIVAEDPNSHTLVTIGSDFKIGAEIKTIEEATSGRIRVAILRDKNSRRGQLAAKSLFKYVTEKLQSGKIPYDNFLNNKDHSALTCTEIVSLAYSLVGIDNIPMYPSHLEFLNSQLKSELGFAQPEVFSPQDLEVDPRFELIGEWRNKDRLPEVYWADAIVGKLFSWIQSGEVKLYQNLAANLAFRLFSNRVAKELGVEQSEQSEAKNLLSYGSTLNFFINKMNTELKLLTVGRDTQKMTVQDYENLLHSSLFEGQ